MIKLDPRYNGLPYDHKLSRELFDSLPLSISALMEDLEKENDSRIRLQRLCLSLIPMTFQYFALMFAGEYLSATTPASNRVTDSLWNMIRKPGPGKWVFFIREAVKYFYEHTPKVISRAAVQSIHETLISDQRPTLQVFDKGKGQEKIDYYSALVNIRNRFAHSRHVDEDQAQVWFSDYYQVWKSLILLLNNVFHSRILIRDSTTSKVVAFDRREPEAGYDGLSPDDPMVLWDKDKEASVRLFPLMISVEEDPRPTENALFLEEVKAKNLLYLLENKFIQRKDEYVDLVRVIDARTVKEKKLSSNDLTISILEERINRITQQTLIAFEDHLKYIPEMFLERPLLREDLDRWMESDLPGYILIGEPGAGKTCLVADWCIKRRERGDHVLLMEASKLEDTDLPRVLEQMLDLGSPFKSCLDSINDKNRDLRNRAKSSKFVCILDAVNEFIGEGIKNRSMLWQEIDRLAGLFDYYRPDFKILVTTRSDLWKDDFPSRDFLHRTLKTRNYFGDHKHFDIPVRKLGQLSIREVEDIYEAARSAVPGMAPITPFDFLNDKTKTTMTNPFILRLVLQTYNGLTVPSLTKTKVLKEFAQNMALKEQKKKEVLFHLLDRISQLRMTEITIDQFLGGADNGKVGRKLKNIKEIIFDPRSSSPYRQLIQDGIVEESILRKGGEHEEMISFSQEKIMDIMFSEFKKKQIKKILVSGLYGYIIPFLLALGVYFALRLIEERNTEIIQAQLEKTQLSKSQVAEISASSAQILKSINNFQFTGYAATFFSFYTYSILFLVFVRYVRFIGAKAVAQDLPSSFLKEKFAELKHDTSKFWYLPCGLFVLYLAFQAVKISLGDQPSISQAFAPIVDHVFFLFLLIFATEMVQGTWVVLKYSKSSKDVYTMFGFNEVKHSVINFSVMFLFIPMTYVFVLGCVFMLDVRNSPEVVSAQDHLLANPIFTDLERSSPRVFQFIYEIIYKINLELIVQFRQSLDDFFIQLIWALPVAFGIVLFIEFILGKLLERVLAWKLSAARGGEKNREANARN